MSRALPDDPNCDLVVEQVTDYLEGKLPEEALVRFEEHLVYCGGCVRYLRQIRAQIAASAHLAIDEPPPAAEVKRALLQRFRERRR